MVSPADTSADYPPPTPHDPLTEVFPDVFLVRDSYRSNAFLRFNRNMTVVRQGGSLLPGFEYIAALPFRHLIPGHGSVCRDDAQRKAQDAIRAIWSEYGAQQ